MRGFRGIIAVINELLRGAVCGGVGACGSEGLRERERVQQSGSERVSRGREHGSSGELKVTVGLCRGSEPACDDVAERPEAAASEQPAAVVAGGRVFRDFEITVFLTLGYCSSARETVIYEN